MEECLQPIPEYEAGESTEHRARCVLADHEYDPTQALADDYFESPVEERSGGDASSGEESVTAQADGGESGGDAQ